MRLRISVTLFESNGVFIIFRDWGHAKDYVEAMWHMLQLEKPEDFVIATGQMHSVREFVEKSFAYIGKEIVWEGQGIFYYYFKDLSEFD